jgi:hypothetical protein
MARFLKSGNWVFLLLICFYVGAWGVSEDVAVKGAAQFLMV